MREGDALMRWLLQVRSALGGSAWGPALALDGCDVFDLALSPLYTTLLRHVREQGGGQPPLASERRTIAGRLRHRLAGDLRQGSAILRTGLPRSASIAFWPREPTHVATQVAVAAVLERRGIRTIFLANQPVMSTRLRQEGLRPVYLPAWASRTRLADARAARRAAAAIAEDPGPWPALCLPHGDLVATVRSVLRDVLPYAHRTHRQIRAGLARIAPGVLVVGNDITVEGRLGARLARQSGIASAILSHGIAVGNPLHAEHVVDRLLVYGLLDRDFLVGSGVSGHCIIEVGAPHLDKGVRQTGRLDPAVAARLGLGARPYVLVATSGAGMSVSQRHHEAVVQELLVASAALPGVDFVAKLHRKDDPELYRRLALRIPGARLAIVAHEDRQGLPDDITAWLQGCAALITGASTSAVDASLLQVPVITVDLAGELGQSDFIASGASVHVTREGALVEAVERVAVRGVWPEPARANAKAYLEAMYGPLDGHAADRAADALVAMLGA